MPRRSTKTQEKELKREERQIQKLSSMEAVLQTLQSHMGQITPSQRDAVQRHIDENYSSGVDVGYLKTILFPERNSYDIPQPLSSLSYCRFSTKEQVTLATGSTGNGMLIWFPRTSVGPSLFYLQGAIPTTTAIPLVTSQNINSTYPGTMVSDNQSDGLNSTWFAGFSQDYSTSFTSMALVSASISIQYVGQLELEQGLIVGGHIYGINPNNIQTNDIENAQWVVRARPGEGCRFVYLPFDNQDFEYFDVQQGFSRNQGNQTVGQNEKYFNFSKYLDLNLAGTSSSSYTYCPGSTGSSSQMMTGYSQTTNYVAIYFTGLQGGVNSLRIDATRRFNGTPTSSIRNIVDLTRPKRNFDAKKTINVLNQLCLSSPIGGHTLKEIDGLVDRIETSLSNAPLLASGGMNQMGSMSELASQLEAPNLERKQLDGQVEGLTGLKRIYPYI